MLRYLCAVDVGTGSARVGVFDRDGQSLSRAEHPIILNRPAPDHAEHDSEDIWSAVCAATRAALSMAGISGDEVAGISFDATCSLVARDGGGRPVSVSTTGQSRWDTICWLDHRAMREAEECTATGHKVLDYLGGVMSPEMQTPKLMWLKRHLPESWTRAHYFFDLADFLTWKASGSNERSQCTLTCKWTYLAHAPEGWSEDYLKAVGLDDLLVRGGLPQRAVAVGSDLGPLSEKAAGDLGLTTECRVGAGLVDAYAGALGLLGRSAGDAAEMQRRVAIIAGTSSCAMVLSHAPVAYGGSWGPYWGVVLPDHWLTEGGQSASGALLDHVIRWHGSGGEPTPDQHRRVIERIGELRTLEGDGFAARLNVLPDFHGNRSPLADPRALGVISGLAMDSGFDSLCALYWRTAVALALGLRHILDAIRSQGQAIDTLCITGGHTRNSLLMELYADVLGCRVVTLESADATLLGAAISAAVAAGIYPSLAEAAAAMAGETRTRLPSSAAAASYDRDYRIFLAMQEHRREVEQLMAMEPDGRHQRSGGPFADKRLIIFDCDGVLVDSEMIATAVLVDHLNASGLQVTMPEIAEKVIGRSAASVQAMLLKTYGVRIDAPAEKRLQERLFVRFREELKPIEGIRQLLDRLTVPYCLASSSSPKRIQVTLAAAGLADRFTGRIFSASMVARGKPAPDLFLHVAKTMGVEPRDCLVIEDSPAGIEAAKRAGIAVIGFLGGSHAQGATFRADLTGLSPDAICSTAEEVLGLIA